MTLRIYVPDWARNAFWTEPPAGSTCGYGRPRAGLFLKASDQEWR
jgi:hypothetical protein